MHTSSLRLSLLALCFCACSGPTQEASEWLPALPSAFAQEDTDELAQIDPYWWHSFESPQLNRWVDTALAANLDLAAASAALRQAEASAKMASGARWPSLSAGLNAARSRSNLIGLPFPGADDVLPITSTSMGLSLAVSWELDLWGRLAAASQAAEADLLAQQADWHAARLSIAGQTVKSWVAWQEASLQFELGQAVQENAIRREAALRRRYAQGLVEISTLLEAESLRAQQAAKLEQLRWSRDEQARALSFLLGTAEPLHVQDATTDPQLPALPAPLPAGVPSELLQRRPDLVAAEARYYAAEARHRQARASLYPRLSLTASGGTSSNEFGDLLDGDFRVWSLAGGLTAPLFQGGQLRAQADARLAGSERAGWLFARALLAALHEVNSTLQSERSLAAQHAEMHASRVRSENAYTIALRRFGAGGSNSIELLERERAQLEFRSAELDLLARALQRRVDLYLALGGGFQAQEQHN